MNYDETGRAILNDAYLITGKDCLALVAKTITDRYVMRNNKTEVSSIRKEFSEPSLFNKNYQGSMSTVEQQSKFWSSTITMLDLPEFVSDIAYQAFVNDPEYFCTELRIWLDNSEANMHRGRKEEDE